MDDCDGTVARLTLADEWGGRICSTRFSVNQDPVRTGDETHVHEDRLGDLIDGRIDGPGTVDRLASDGPRVLPSMIFKALGRSQRPAIKGGKRQEPRYHHQFPHQTLLCHRHGAGGR